MENTGCTINKDTNTTITYCTKMADKNNFAVLMVSAPFHPM